MSFADRPTLSTGKKIGCLAYGALGTVLILSGLTVAALGHCAPREDGTGCENDGLIKFLFFPGSLILVAGVGILLAWYLMRRD